MGVKVLSEKKMVRRNLALAVGIICVVLVAGLAAAIEYYTVRPMIKTERYRVSMIRST